MNYCDVMEDGFLDPGRSNPLLTREGYLARPLSNESGTEVLLFDSTTDPKLHVLGFH